MKRSALVTLIALVSVSLQACGSASTSTQTAATTVTVRTTTVRAGSLDATTDFSGSLVAVHRATVGALTPGRIETVVVHAGDRVAAGQTLARVDSAQYSAMLAGAQAGANAAGAGATAAMAGLQQAQSRYDLAAKTAQRMGNLYAAGAISQEQRDQVATQLHIAQAGVDQARAQVAAASGGVAAAQAGVSAASVPVNDATIVAPFDGIITKTFVRQGEVVGAGSPVVRIESDGLLELEVAVPLATIAAIRSQSELPIHVDAIGDTALRGTVRSVAPSDNPALRSAMLRIDLPPHPGLLPGMFARVVVRVPSPRGMIVPLAALAVRAGQTGVFEVRDGKATFLPVDSVASDTRSAIVTGLAAGSTIAISGLSQLTDGAAVTVSAK
ncbi:MAG: efflux RND transporter periplasmic adaptor subunit [Vulcanimicrobiaceae bacterium]